MLLDLKMGFVEPSFTFLFQIINTILLILVIFLIYSYIKKFKARRINSEIRLRKCEDDIEYLKDNIK
ncbi:MAG: hypothetical protein WBA54_03460 [Acidaminobacteraceae bacterium]